MSDALNRIVEELAKVRADLHAHLLAHARAMGPYVNPADEQAAKEVAERFVDDVRQALEELGS